MKLLLFRDDLRVHDNPALVAAAGDEDGFVPVYVFDERDYGETRHGTEKTGRGVRSSSAKASKTCAPRYANAAATLPSGKAGRRR